MPTSTVEDYLKCILLEEQALEGREAESRAGDGRGREERVGTGQIAARLALTPGTVTSMLKALADMNVSLTDGAGARLGGGKGSDILEHPLNAVVWLAGALAQEGLAMQPGDLISLGSFSPLLPPKSGLSVTATYEGLPGAAPVRVTFK